MSLHTEVISTISTAVTLASVIGSSVGHYLDGFLVDPKKTKECNAITTKSLAQCDILCDGDFIFHTIHVYARPIQDIGVHNTENDEKASEEANKNNAQRASNGYHHALLILSYGDPEPSQYLLDRVEGVRFIKVNPIKEKELTSGHLILIKEYIVNIKYKEIKSFIQKESLFMYNAAQNNCLHFVYNFIDKIIQKNEWNKQFDTFWKYIAGHFDVKDIEKGIYNEQQNHFEKELFKKKLLVEQKIKANNDKKRRLQWRRGDKVLIKSKTSQGTTSWYVGKIKEIGEDELAMDHADDEVVVRFEKMGKTFTTQPIRIMNEKLIKPYIKIPTKFLDPITYKMMTDPVQILRSGQVYDAITVKYMQQTGMVIDPITGVLVTIGNKKPVVERQLKLKECIEQFIEEHDIEQEVKNDFDSVNNEEIWDNSLQKLHDKYDIKQQQQKIYQKTELIFFPVDDQSMMNDIKQKGWMNKLSDITSLIRQKNQKNNGDEKKIDIQRDANFQLQWNVDHMFINHTSIPIVTCMGSSRVGKSFLLNEILRSQEKWKNDKTLQGIEVFETCGSGDVAMTKGAWISLYGEIDNSVDNKYDDEKQDDDISLIDQWPEDDISMWSTDDIIYWFNSLNPKFDKTYPKLRECVESLKLNGRTLSNYKEKDIEELIKTADMKKKEEHALINILRKRIQNTMDEIESERIAQMYLVDMEGLSHGVTQFTHKIFHGCYAISNVVIWYDPGINSDHFKTLMKELKESMELVAKSKRKPAFIYLLRNADTLDYDFEITDDIDCDDEFDHYLKHSNTFEEFRKMNIFSSIHGYQLVSPVNLIKTNWKRGRKKSVKKQKIYYDDEILNELIETIKFVSNKTKRFAHSTHVLNDQVNNINKYSSLSPEKRITLCNSRLKWFVLIDKSNDAKKSKERQLQIKNAIITFNENVHCVEENFEIGYKSLQAQLSLRCSPISKEFKSQLIKNEKEIISEIRKREKNAKTADKYGAASIVTGSVGTVAALVGVATVLSGGTALLVFGATVGVSYRLYLAQTSYRPEKLGKIEESELEELNMY